MNIVTKIRSKLEENDDEVLRQALEVIIELTLAVEKSQIALDDWINLYAPEFCNEIRVEAARRRVKEYGTLGYIANTNAVNRAAIKMVYKEDEAVRTTLS